MSCGISCDPVGVPGGASGPEATAENVGGFAEVYVDGSDNPFEFRTIQSSDASITVTQNAQDLDLVVAGGPAFEFKRSNDESSVVVQNNTGTYVTVWTSAASNMSAGENWYLWVNCLICHPIGISNAVNSVFQWQIETSSGVFTTLETNIATRQPIGLQAGEKSPPYGRFYPLLPVAFTGARIRLQYKMSSSVIQGGQAEYPRYMAIRVP